MTIAPVVRPTSNEPTDDRTRGIDERSRISFRQPISTGGFIDAAWWPRTRDLTIELPALMDVLWTAGREINRITFNLHAWKPAPRRMRIEGRTMRLGGFATSDPQSVRLSDPWGAERVDILVIAPETDPAVAQRIFDLASETDNPYRAQEIIDEARGTAADSTDRS